TAGLTAARAASKPSHSLSLGSIDAEEAKQLRKRTVTFEQQPGLTSSADSRRTNDARAVRDQRRQCRPPPAVRRSRPIEGDRLRARIAPGTDRAAHSQTAGLAWLPLLAVDSIPFAFVERACLH